MNIALICISLLTLLCLILGTVVTVARGKLNSLSGHSDNPEDSLHKLVRAHGNSIEYVTLLALLMFILSLYQPAGWVYGCMIAATFCRFLFVAGILIPKTMAKPNAMRFIGAVGTYISGTGLGFALLITAV